MSDKETKLDKKLFETSCEVLTQMFLNLRVMSYVTHNHNTPDGEQLDKWYKEENNILCDWLEKRFDEIKQEEYVSNNGW